jgi:hypothetical protein
MKLTAEIKAQILDLVKNLDRDAVYRSQRAAQKAYQALSDSPHYHLTDEGHEAYKVVDAWFHARHLVDALISLRGKYLLKS